MLDYPHGPNVNKYVSLSKQKRKAEESVKQIQSMKRTGGAVVGLEVEGVKCQGNKKKLNSANKRHELESISFSKPPEKKAALLTPRF